MRSYVFSMTVSILLAAISLPEVSVAQRGFGPPPGRGPMGDPDFVVDRDTFHFLLENHDQIRRTVTNIENGVVTVTESDDPDITDKIQEHVAAMYERVKEGRPIRLRDPLFAELFRHAEAIEMQVEDTPKGIRVTETSDDPRVAQLIQEHADVVSKFVARGFAEARLNHAVPAAITAERTDASAEAKLTPDERQQLLALSAAYDRVYIPALALTSAEQAKPSAAALRRLEAKHPELRRQVLELLSAGDDGDPIVDIIKQAQSLVAAGDVKQAHETLEPIRGMLTEQRIKLGLDYPVDVLNDYHEVMESIVKPAAGMEPGEVDDAYLADLRQAAAEASHAWAKVEQTDFSGAYLGLSEQQLEELDGYIARERGAITRLNRELRAGNDATSVLNAATALKPPFAKAYKMFGNFNGLR